MLVATPNELNQVKTYVGTVIWRLDNKSASPHQSLSTAVDADVDIPGKLKMTLTLKKNMDSTVPVSHTMTIAFTVEPTRDTGEIKQISLPQLRNDDTPYGQPLAGVPVPIMKNSFLIGLTNGNAEKTNLDLIRQRQWFDIPILFTHGRIAKLTFEEGASGRQALNKALSLWSDLKESETAASTPSALTGTVPGHAASESQAVLSDNNDGNHQSAESQFASSFAQNATQQDSEEKIEPGATTQDLAQQSTAPGFEEMLTDTGCHSVNSDEKKADLFETKYKDKEMMVTGEANEVNRGEIGIRVLPSTLTFDVAVTLSDPQSTYDLQKGRRVTVRFVARTGGGCILPYSGDQGVLVR